MSQILFKQSNPPQQSAFAAHAAPAAWHVDGYTHAPLMHAREPQQSDVTAQPAFKARQEGVGDPLPHPASSSTIAAQATVALIFGIGVFLSVARLRP